MALHQLEGAVEARPRAQALHEWPVSETPAAQEECGIAAKCAEEHGDESLPRYEHALMCEEAGEDRRRLAFGDAGDEDGDQPVLLDQRWMVSVILSSSRVVRRVNANSSRTGSFSRRRPRLALLQGHVKDYRFLWSSRSTISIHGDRIEHCGGNQMKKIY